PPSASAVETDFYPVTLAHSSLHSFPTRRSSDLFSVAQRTREIGIRVALGAERKQIMSLIAWQGMQVVLIGVALGLPISFLLARQDRKSTRLNSSHEWISYAVVCWKRQREPLSYT